MASLPLFVLPMVLFPGEVQELRVFEPRYRQMLDDCLLDNQNFGLVMNNPLSPSNHWDGPMQFGCEAKIIHHETKGSNHFLKIIGGRRFKILDVVDPALPPFDHPMMESLAGDDGYLPDLETIIQMIPEGSEHSKLYISAEVEYLDSLPELTHEQQNSLKSIMQNVLSRIGKMMNIDNDTISEWIEQSPMLQVVDESPESIYSVASLVVHDLYTRQDILQRSDNTESISVLRNHLPDFTEEE
tara:strand:+ start:15355 stop:16080 length:726 start_codon:yes stop_codon:yes gene_type:complete